MVALLAQLMLFARLGVDTASSRHNRIDSRRTGLAANPAFGKGGVRLLKETVTAI